MAFLEWLMSLFVTKKKPPVITTIVEIKQPPWVVEMLKAFGKHEVRDYDWLMKWLVSDGRRLGDVRKLPWCGDGMETAIKLSLPDEPWVGALAANPYWARNWINFGVPVLPTIYCIGVFSRGKGGHVGIIIGEDAECYHVLGANQGDSVSVVRIVKTRLIATRWPASYPKPKEFKLPGLSNKIAVSANEV